MAYLGGQPIWGSNLRDLTRDISSEQLTPARYYSQYDANQPAQQYGARFGNSGKRYEMGIDPIAVQTAAEVRAARDIVVIEHILINANRNQRSRPACRQRSRYPRYRHS